MKKVYYIIIVAALVVCYTSNARPFANQEVDAITSATQETKNVATQKAKKKFVNKAKKQEKFLFIEEE